MAFSLFREIPHLEIQNSSIFQLWSVLESWEMTLTTPNQKRMQAYMNRNNAKQVKCLNRAWLFRYLLVGKFPKLGILTVFGGTTLSWSPALGNVSNDSKPKTDVS